MKQRSTVSAARPLPPRPLRSAVMVALLALASALWIGPPELLPVGLVLASVLLVWAVSTGALRTLGRLWWVALLGLLASSMVGLSVSTDLDLSLPRLHGIVLGMDTLAVMLSVLITRRQLQFAGGILLLATALVVGVALVGTDWPGSDGKGLLLTPIYDRLPRLLTGLPSTPDRLIHPNKLAALLAMLVPVVAAVGVFAERRWQQLLGCAAAVLVTFMVFLTQSRSGYLAALGAVLVLLVLRSRRFAVLLVPYLAFLVWVVIWTVTPAVLVRGLPTPPMADGIGVQFEERRLVWDIAVSMVEDFPLTGIGLGTFPAVADNLYGHILLFGPESDTPHAHNLPLQVAVDLGVPGLASFGLLTVCAARAARRAIQGADSRWMRGLGAGAACGLLAYYLYGITDAIGVGEKPAFVFWVLMGIVAACAGVAERQVIYPFGEPLPSPNVTATGSRVDALPSGRR